MLQPGSQIGRYEIQRRLGRGGMGTVYVAHDPVLGRMVAVKVFAADLDLPDAAQRFAREARSAASLNHPNIVTVHDYGDVASQPFIVMEHVQGETLADIIRRRAPVPLTEKLRWMEELCAGVAYAHRGGVIHRDLKPTNLMISRPGQLKILDFGIARVLGTLAPKATALVGTPGYMAPEQIMGEALDHRADLFSIGVVCYELVSYSEAFPGETVPTITHRILTQEPVPLPELVTGLHRDVVALVARALRKNPAERFEDADAMRAALARVRLQLEDGDSASPDGAIPPTLLADRSPGGGVSKRGTGSERRHTPDAVAVAQLTPPPEHRVDRALLTRRRTEQIDACLERSRVLLQAGDADAALDACVQALTLEETHPGALQLERTIQSALAARRAGPLLEEAREELERRSLTAAQGLLQQVREIDPDNADLKRLDRDLRLARVEETRRRQRAAAVGAAVASAEQALGRGEIETALAFAREALSLDAESDGARALEAEAMRRLDEETAAAAMTRPDAPDAATLVAGLPDPALPATVLSPLRRLSSDVAVAEPASAPPPPTIVAPKDRKTPAPPAPVRRAHGTVVANLRRGLAVCVAAATGVAALRPQQRAIAGAAVATVIVAVAAAAYLLSPRAVPTGAVTIDALPWGTVTSIRAEDGTVQPLPDAATTPLSLTLPAGTYAITLAGPPSDGGTRVITVSVQADGAAAPAPERFRTMTPAEYFEPYLTAPAGASPGEGGAEAEPASGTPPPAPRAPAGTPPLPASVPASPGGRS